jgi:hypothetical protein
MVDSWDLTFATAVGQLMARGSVGGSEVGVHHED